LLARYVQSLAAGSQDAHTRAISQKQVDELGACLHKMLAVVQHHHQLLAPQGTKERGRNWASWLFTDAEDPCHSQRYQARISQRGELHEPDPVGSVECRRELQRQPRLADAAHPGQGQQARALDHSPHLRHIVLAPDETGNRQRQVVQVIGWPLTWNTLPTYVCRAEECRGFSFGEAKAAYK